MKKYLLDVKTMSRKLKVGIFLFLILFFAFSVGIGAGLSYYLDRDHEAKMIENEEKQIENLEEPPPQLTERVNILVMGVDYLKLGSEEGQRGTRTDTIMLFSYNPANNRAFLLSIPRDSRVNISGVGMDKINHAHSYGGTDLAIGTISDFIGLPIHHYVKVDYNAVTQLVDAVGGVEIDVPQDMHYSPLGIHFSKGLQTLNGEQAVKYLRFRSGYNNADIGRIGAQQEFVKLLLEKVVSPSIVTNVPAYVDILSNNVETDMSKKQMLDLSKALLLNFDPSKIEKEVVPGYPDKINGISYWLVDEVQKNDILLKLLSDAPLPEPETVQPGQTQPESSAVQTNTN